MLMIQVFPKGQDAFRDICSNNRVREAILKVRDSIRGPQPKFRIFVGDRLFSSLRDEAKLGDEIHDGAIVTFIEDDPSSEHAW